VSTVIEDVLARKIFNSRGEETIEVDIVTTEGFGRASAPAGASKGKAEVVAFPKGGVNEALRKVEEIIKPKLLGLNADNQEEIDNLLHEIDGTQNFSNIGGNTAYAISLAVAEAAANSYGLPMFQYLAGQLACELPYPLGNILGGGEHTLGRGPDLQEFLVLPLKAQSFLDAVKANILFHGKVASILKAKVTAFSGGRSDEGAWTAPIENEEALNVVCKACEEVCQEVGFECRVGIDFAASTLWNSEEKCYVYSRDGNKKDSGEQLEFVLHLIENYNLIYVEDPFHEEDYESFAELTRKVKKCLVCGDDLFVTNRERLSQGINMHAGNAIIIKVNQVGTLTDAWETTKTARNNGYIPIISHRSGETPTYHIAHLALAFHCPMIKTGVVGGSRIAKLNELIRIEEMLGNRFKMAKLPL